jgi:hypothetical protein
MKNESKSLHSFSETRHLRRSVYDPINSARPSIAFSLSSSDRCGLLSIFMPNSIAFRTWFLFI